MIGTPALPGETGLRALAAIGRLPELLRDVRALGRRLAALERRWTWREGRRPVGERTAEIHPTAVVHPGAQFGPGVRVGPFAVVGAGVCLGEDVEIGPHVGPGGAGRGRRAVPDPRGGGHRTPATGPQVEAGDAVGRPDRRGHGGARARHDPPRDHPRRLDGDREGLLPDVARPHRPRLPDRRQRDHDRVHGPHRLRAGRRAGRDLGSHGDPPVRADRDAGHGQRVLADRPGRAAVLHRRGESRRGPRGEHRGAAAGGGGGGRPTQSPARVQDPLPVRPSAGAGAGADPRERRAVAARSSVCATSSRRRSAGSARGERWASASRSGCGPGWSAPATWGSTTSWCTPSCGTWTSWASWTRMPGRRRASPPSTTPRP